MKLILFDVDNTMIKSTKSHTKAFMEGLSKVFGIAFSKADFENAGPPGMTDPEIVIVAGKRRGIPEGEILNNLKKISEASSEAFERLAREEELKLLPGVRELLERLRKNAFTLGVMTGNFEKIGWIKLKKTGIDGFFSFGVFGGEAKNKAEMGKIALEKIRGLYRVEPSFLCVIGDTPRDVEAGRRIGAKTIAVATGNASKEDLRKSNPDLLLDSLKDVELVLSWIVKASGT